MVGMHTNKSSAVFQGSSRLVLGRDRDDVDEVGTGWLEVDVGPGDIIVIPAGVSHRSLTSEGDYRYIGVYPEVFRRPLSHPSLVTDTHIGSPKMA